MTRNRIIILMFSLALLYIVSTSSINGRASSANTGNTGAPGESQTCSSCHSGGNYGTVTPLIQVFQSGTVNTVSSYTAGTVYDLRVTVQFTSGTPGGYGFQMTALTTPANSPLAGYSSLASNVKQKTITTGTFAGRTYVEHNGVSASNIFNMRWTAPAAGTGSLKFYAAGNAVNNNGSRTGDKAGTASITLTETLPMSVSGVTNNVSCFAGNNGAINISVSGGIAPYTFTWSNGTMTEDRTNLSAGNYTVTVTDNGGNTASSTFPITQPSSALSVAGTTTGVSCFGGNNGNINITASGGITPYSYNWGGGITSEDRTNVTGGNYSVTVTDNNGCTISTPFNVEEPQQLTAVATPGAFDCVNGRRAVTVSATGGIAPYTGTGTYYFNPGGQGFLVSDAQGCSDSVSINILSDSCIFRISGNVLTESSLPVPGVTVTLSGSDNKVAITGADGAYSFAVAYGGSYTVTPSKNNTVNSSNGVTSLDIILIQRHLLGTLPFSSPYKIIAADVNNSAGVTSLDIVLSRAVILGNAQSFPNGRLWDFVNSDFIFPNPQAPFPFERERTYSGVSNSFTGQNFIGIKLGDVNGNWDPNVP